jgi:LmbE family N-acetylglucosaminyl deacetylase
LRLDARLVEIYNYAFCLKGEFMNHSQQAFGSWTYRTAKPALALGFLSALLAVGAVIGLPSLELNACPQGSLQAVTDQITYNVGDEVRLRTVSPSPTEENEQDRYHFTVRYAGDDKPVVTGLVLGHAEGPSPSSRLLWKVPLDARAGKYEIDMQGGDSGSAPAASAICSFVVHRQVIRIVSAEVAHPYYAAGDAIGCTVKIENVSGRPFPGLRLEFSERYWPWIAQQSEKAGADITTLKNDFNLKPHEQTSVSSPNCFQAKGGNQETIKQYGAVVWDHDRKNVYAIGFSPLVFVNPPGTVGPRPYPPPYVFPSLDAEAAKITNYRLFHPQPFGASAIQFDTRHTQYPSGAEATVKFSLANPAETPWRQVTVRAKLVGPDEKELTNTVVTERVDLDPHGPKLAQEVKFQLPSEVSGLFHAWVEISDASGGEIAASVLELGVNPLPKSVLVFCAHEDDDGTQMGFIRSLVENQVPVRVVYFTSGDAGSCDRYFQHTCGPAEALNFGAIRMQESRAAIGHLGVRPEDILFLGLPDGGSGKIWYEHTHDPYLAVLLASDHSPYERLFRPNLPYTRADVVEAAEDIIKRFQPDVIYTVHPPAEGHIDHIVCNFFVVKALQELLRAGALPPGLELRVDRIFDPKEHPATPYHYEDHEFYVSGEASALAQEAGWFYQSQGGESGQGNLRTWDQLRRSNGYRKVLDWKEHEGWNEKE